MPTSKYRISIFALYFVFICPALTERAYSQTKPKKIDAKKLRSINLKIQQLETRIAALQRQGLKDPWLAQLQVYLAAATKIVEHDEFFRPVYADWTLDALDRGLLRCKFAATGDFPWLQKRGHAVVRGYRSRIDGSVQPYAVRYPPDYGIDPKKKWRVDVVLHGRDKSLTEVKFLNKHKGDDKSDNKGFVQIDVYGRGNNAYRWAGERDVQEAINAFWYLEGALGRANLLDQTNMILRGFSMGGAGTWHLGLHMPDKWRALGPGAGFTRTHGYVKNLPKQLPTWQESCLHIYDAVDYAENVFHIPVVAYAGSKDRQLQAARNIQRKLKPFAFAKRMKLLIAPGLGHQFPMLWRLKAEKEFQKISAAKRSDYPQKLRFTTFTLKYPRCFWLEIIGLQEHYKRTLVEAEWFGSGYKIQTKNVVSMHLRLPKGAPRMINMIIDDQKFKMRPWTGNLVDYHVYLRKQDGRWKPTLPQFVVTAQLRSPRKSAGLQGPIDDAFTAPFLCVRGTGKPWHDRIQSYADKSLARFQIEWAKYWRGSLPVKDDVDVSPKDVAGKHLILFGDPSSNSLIRHVLDGLPLEWNENHLRFGASKFKSKDCLPALIFPSPLNSNKYVVLNSGHTFHEKDYRGTNALLFPRWGDYAILKVKSSKENPLAIEIRRAGLFDDQWRIGKTKKSQ